MTSARVESAMIAPSTRMTTRFGLGTIVICGSVVALAIVRSSRAPGYTRRAVPSRHVGAAVDVDELAGDPARLLGGEEHRDPGDLLGTRDAAERDLARAHRDLLLGVAVPRLRGVGEPGRDRVDADAVR